MIETPNLARPKKANLKQVLFCFALTLLLPCKNVWSQQPNVIVIMTDDQGYGDIAALGNPMIRTPHLDRLHKESVRFTDFHVNSFCAPTRAALMTGRMSDRTHVRSTVYGRQFLNLAEATMADYFKASGYKTAHFGKWHLGDNYPYRPIDRGFDAWLGQGGGAGSASDYWANNRWNDYYNRGAGKWDSIPGFGTDVFFNETLKFIDKHKTAPFFIYLATYVPHGPMDVLKQWRDVYEKKYGAAPAKQPWGDVWDLYASISRFDYNLGRLRNFLDEKGLAENTIIIFLTDNGTASGASVYNAGMRGQKGSSYEGGHRVPLFLHWPKGKLPEEKNINAFTWHFDLLPTLIDFCKLKTPERPHQPLDGKSLAPLIKGTVSEAAWNASDRTVFMHTQNTKEVPVKGQNTLVATSTWRLIDGKELYDIKKDPGQKEDIAAGKPAVLAELNKRYDEHWNSVNIPDFLYPRPVIGSAAQTELSFNTETWIKDTASVHTWNQQSVLDGVKGSGFWPVHIAQEGKYRIEIRRWPAEVDQPINSGLPAYIDDKMTLLGEPYKIPKGRRLSIAKVRLEIDGNNWEKPVNPSDRFISFELRLTTGDKTIRAWLVDEKGEKWGAYFVYVKPVR